MKQSLPTFVLEEFFPFQTAVLADRLSRKLSEHYREQFGISIVEWRILVNLAYSKPASVRDIEQRVSLGRSKVSRATSRLESKGYLTKQIHPEDHRLLNLELTEQGRAFVAEIVPKAQEQQAALEDLLGEDAMIVKAALGRLLKHVQD